MPMRRLPALLLALLATAAAAQAPAPTTIPYQGVLTDAAGLPVADGSYTVALRLFEAASGGTADYAEDHTVTTADGWFAVALGSGTATTGTWGGLAFDQAWWVETAVDGTTLSPRAPLGASPYARGLSVPAEISGDAPDGAAVFVTNTATSGGFGNGLTVTGAAVGTSRALNAQTAAPQGIGVYGWATSGINQTYGVYGRASSTAGFGVYGTAEATGGFTAGVVGEAASTDGSGVVGRSNAASGPAKGVYGEADSPDGAGLWGVNLATTGEALGVYAETTSPGGLAFYGRNLAVTGFAHGGYARTESTQGTALVGRAAATTGTTTGVLGETNSTSGRAVYGLATASTGATRGVFGQSASTSGRGVYGWASAATNQTYGVYGLASSTAGFGTYGLANAASGFTAGVVGEAASPDGSGVVGRSTAATGEAKGVYGESSAPNGVGVWGASLSATGEPIGVKGVVTASAGRSGDFVGGRGIVVQSSAVAVTELITAIDGTNIRFRVWNDGEVTADGAFTSGGADFAEYFPLAPEAAAAPGDVVGLRAGRVSLTTAGAEQLAIVSSDPALVGNPGAAEGGALVALVGQVEARVTGPAAPGDLLVASGRADGTARAVAADAYVPADGPVIGRVLRVAAPGRVVALVGVDEAAALRAVVARQQDQIDALSRRLEALLDRLGLEDVPPPTAQLR